MRRSWEVTIALYGLASLALVGCSTVPPADPTVAGDPMSCASGELALPDGRCQPAGLPLDMPCPPGELVLGGGRCQPAGVPPEACGAGFTPDGRDGCDVVLPEEACARGLMAVPGDSACREIAPCGQGTYGEIPIDGDTELVDATYPGDDSDGSPARPWRTIQDGVDAARPGAIVAVAAGRYEEAVRISGKHVRLWGRCPRLVEVAAQGLEPAAIEILGPDASASEVRDLAITAQLGGVHALGASSVTLARIWVHDTGNAGIIFSEADGASLRGSLIDHSYNVGVVIEAADATLEGVVVRDIQQVLPAKVNGWGVGVFTRPETGERGVLTLRGSLIERNHEFGVILGGSGATIEGSVVRGTRSSTAGGGGLGIGVFPDTANGERGALTLRASLIDANRVSGVHLEGAEATIEASVVRGTQVATSFDAGRGVNIDPDRDTGERGALSLRTSLIEQNRQAGVHIADSDVTIEASVVRGTQSNAAGEEGDGIIVQAERTGGRRPTLSLSASRIEQNHGHGVFIAGSEATIDATVVRDTEPESDGASFGRGIGAQYSSITGERAALSVRRSLIDRNRDFGVFIAGSDANIEASVVRGTLLNAASEFGRGVSVQRSLAAGEGGTLSLRACLIEHNHEFGLFIAGSGATVEASVVRETEPNDAGNFGRGVSVQPDPDTAARGTLSLSTSLVDHNRSAGIFIASSDATIDASVVQSTQVSRAGGDFGDGIIVLDHAVYPTLSADPGTIPSVVALHATQVTGNARAGLLFVGSSGSLSGVRASDNRFGLVFQGTVRPALGEGNEIRGNTERDNVADGDLTIPDAAPPIP